MNLFDPDSPLMEALSFIGRLILVNICFLLCCIPVVTIGAACTALYTVTLAQAENRELTSALGTFFAAFKRNFVQATVLWLIMLGFGALLFFDFRALTAGPFEGNRLMSILFMIGAICYVPTLTFLFPVQAKFDNTVFNTLKNSLALGFAKFPQMLFMAALHFLPLIFLYFSQVFFFRTLILWIIIAFAATAQINSYLLRRIFRKLIAQETPPEPTEEDNE